MGREELALGADRLIDEGQVDGRVRALREERHLGRLVGLAALEDVIEQVDELLLDEIRSMRAGAGADQRARVRDRAAGRKDRALAFRKW
jgi:hypothetical protein